MKFGLRTPSFKKSLSARTSGVFNRAIKRVLIPGYGKKGIGWLSNPKKALHNKVYRSLTIGLPDILSNKRHDKSCDHNIIEIDKSQEIRNRGIEQAKYVLKFISDNISSTNLNCNIVNAMGKIGDRSSKYLNKATYINLDLYQFITNDIENILSTAKKENTKYECKIALEIIKLLQSHTDNNEIIDIIKQSYPSRPKDIVTNSNLREVTESKTKRISIPDELLYNSDNKTVKDQEQLIYSLSDKIIKGNTNIVFINAWIKVLSHTERFKRRNTDLFKTLIYTLTANVDIVKRDSVKKEYKIAADVVRLININQTESIDTLCNILKNEYKF